MPKLPPEETTQRVIKATSWIAFFFAILMMLTGWNLDTIGPIDDRPGRMLNTVGFTASALSTAWWAIRHATAPTWVRAALVTVEVVTFGPIVLARWTQPSLPIRVTFYVAAATLVVMGIELWRYRKRTLSAAAKDLQGSVSDALQTW